MGLGSRAFEAAGALMSKPAMRPLTRTFSNLHATLYRLTRGAASNPKYPTMLLTVTGRKSGVQRTVPLIYLNDDARLVVAAAYAGSDADPAWWLNLQANPDAVVTVRDRTFPVRAALAPPGQREDLWWRLVQMYPYFIGYQQRTSRQIPVVILEPVE